MKNRSAFILTGFCLATCFAWSLQDPYQQPTLADVARQKRAEKAKKVYTNEDMKAAPEPIAAPAETAAPAEGKPALPKSTEAVAAVEAKVTDLRERELMLNKNIARFETSMSTADQEGNESRKKTYQESIDSAKASLADATQQRIAAEKELDEMKAAVASAAGAAASKKKPAPKSPAPKS